MSTYILMKLLESAPGSYDRGIRLITFGKLDEVYDRFSRYIEKGHVVLDIGCGTGALTLKAALKQARVKGIDINPRMLEIAAKRLSEAGCAKNVEFVEMGVAELGNEITESYDVAMSVLCFSELTSDELHYSLKEISRILKPGGLLLVADEVRPERISRRILHWLLRIPFWVITYILTRTSTTAVRDLPSKIQETGLTIESLRTNRLDNFVELVGKKPDERAG
jgi:ubiquinone/menaquinone biosynthesis C-methylase UbiE